MNTKEIVEQTGVTMDNVYACYECDIERFAELVRQDYLRELKALKPVGEFMIAADINGKNCYIHVEDKDTFTFTLYALDEEVKHD